MSTWLRYRATDWEGVLCVLHLTCWSKHHCSFIHQPPNIVNTLSLKRWWKMPQRIYSVLADSLQLNCYIHDPRGVQQCKYIEKKIIQSQSGSWKKHTHTQMTFPLQMKWNINLPQTPTHAWKRRHTVECILRMRNLDILREIPSERHTLEQTHINRIKLTYTNNMHANQDARETADTTELRARWRTENPADPVCCWCVNGGHQPHRSVCLLDFSYRRLLDLCVCVTESTRVFGVSFV